MREMSTPPMSRSGISASSRASRVHEMSKTICSPFNVPSEKAEFFSRPPVQKSRLQNVAFPRRTLRECLAEELRRLDADVLYGRVITEGWTRLDRPSKGLHD